MNAAAPVHRELIALSVRNARKSVPLLLIAAAFVAWTGFRNGQVVVSTLVLTLSLATAAWRLHIAARFDSTCDDDQVLAKVERHMALTALLAGMMWATATLGVYPHLPPLDRAAHLVVVTGSAALAGHFMTLVRWGYPLLVGPSLGALALVCLVVPETRSLPIAILATLYALTLVRVGVGYRDTMAEALQHGEALQAANLALMQAKESADASATARLRFLATMSHEIRTPMNGVLGSLDMLRRLRLGDEERKLVKTAAACGETLMGLLNDVLDHAKIESDRLELSPGPASLHAICASVVSLFQGNADGKGISLRMAIEEDVPEWVIADHQRLKQVLLNLVCNAVKFTETGSVMLHLRRADSIPGLVGVRFEIRDTGRGMRQEELECLFRPFSQVNNGQDVPNGTGLGLSISQAIVTLMGGRIAVISTPGEGSAFAFTLNLIPHDMPTPLPATTPRMDTPSGMLDAMAPLEGTVLLVEDDAVNRLIARSMLESFGLSVCEACDGQEALAVAQTRDFDVVLMDCQMPRMDGYTCSMQWRAIEATRGLPRTPIIALTANAFNDDVARARDAGMDSHLSKPYSRLQLREQIAHWL